MPCRNRACLDVSQDSRIAKDGYGARTIGRLAMVGWLYGVTRAHISGEYCCHFLRVLKACFLVLLSRLHCVDHESHLLCENGG